MFGEHPKIKLSQTSSRVQQGRNECCNLFDLFLDYALHVL